MFECQQINYWDESEILAGQFEKRCTFFIKLQSAFSILGWREFSLLRNALYRQLIKLIKNVLEDLTGKYFFYDDSMSL